MVCVGDGIGGGGFGLFVVCCLDLEGWNVGLLDCWIVGCVCVVCVLWRRRMCWDCGLFGGLDFLIIISIKKKLWVKIYLPH